MTQPDWDDERLNAAFHAHFDRAAPETLARDIHVRIAGTTPSRLGAVRLRPAWSVAVAVVVVVAVAGTALIGLGGLGRSGGPPLASDVATSTPGPDATPTEQALAGSLFDGALPIVSVSDAIATRDAGDDDREIAVHGWFQDSIAACPAPLVAPVSPLQLACPDQFVWLMEQAELLIHRSGNLTSGGGPRGPGLNPDLDGIDRSWEQDRVASNGDSVPLDVVFVGHFDDRRAALCPPDEIDACRDRFVVDSVAIVHGVPQPTSVMREAGNAVSSEHDIAAIVADEAPGSPILSATVVELDGLARLEPSLDAGHLGSVDHPNLWIVRVLESERAVTYVVIDGSDAIFEMNPDGQPILVGGTPPTPAATASSAAWPPSGALVVELTSQVEAGAPPVRVAVIDQSGRVEGADEKGDVDPATQSFPGRFYAYAEPGHPERIHLAWIGGICDSQITVTVGADIRTITFDMGPVVDCDSIGVERQLVLQVSGAVDVPSIEVVEAIGSPLPASVLGLPVIRVNDAVAIRDAGHDDRELAVLGWFTPMPAPTCGDSVKTYSSPLQLHCPGEPRWVTEDAESQVPVTGGGITALVPQGPALNPHFDGLNTDWGPATAVEVVFVGHFDDRRAELCPPDEVAACRDRFVVNWIAAAQGEPRPPSTLSIGVRETSARTDIEEIVAREAPQAPVLSTTIVDGRYGLAAIEPSVATAQQGLTDQPVVWVVRVLTAEGVATYLIVDGTDAIYEVDQQNQVILVGGTPPTP